MPAVLAQHFVFRGTIEDGDGVAAGRGEGLEDEPGRPAAAENRERRRTTVRREGTPRRRQVRSALHRVPCSTEEHARPARRIRRRRLEESLGEAVADDVDRVRRLPSARGDVRAILIVDEDEAIALGDRAPDLPKPDRRIPDAPGPRLRSEAGPRVLEEARVVEVLQAVRAADQRGTTGDAAAAERTEGGPFGAGDVDDIVRTPRVECARDRARGQRWPEQVARMTLPRSGPQVVGEQRVAVVTEARERLSAARAAPSTIPASDRRESRRPAGCASPVLRRRHQAVDSRRCTGPSPSPGGSPVPPARAQRDARRTFRPQSRQRRRALCPPRPPSSAGRNSDTRAKRYAASSALRYCTYWANGLDNQAVSWRSCVSAPSE